MKLLVLSGVSGSVDRVVDILQQSNSVVAKESTMTNEALARAAQAALETGTYDMVMVIAKDPIGAGMLLNKREMIEAAVCGSADDARLAKDNGANVIVIRDAGSDSLGDILKEVSGSAGISQKLRASVKIPALAKRQDSGEDEDQDAAPKARKAPARKPAEEEDDSEDEQKLESLSAQRKGIVGKLKDALGIL